MRAVVSLSFPEDMAQELDRMARRTGRSRSDLAREALRRYIWEDRLARLRETLAPAARKKGVVTDEDIFKSVS